MNSGREIDATDKGKISIENFSGAASASSYQPVEACRHVKQALSALMKIDGYDLASFNEYLNHKAILERQTYDMATCDQHDFIQLRINGAMTYMRFLPDNVAIFGGSTNETSFAEQVAPQGSSAKTAEIVMEKLTDIMPGRFVKELLAAHATNASDAGIKFQGFNPV